MNMKYERIYNFGNIITGKTPKTSIDEYWNGPYPFITPTDIPSYDTKTLFTTERTISNLGMQKQKNTLLPIGTICVSCIATIGKVCQVDKPSISNQQINSIIPNEKFDSNYLYYLFRYNLPYFECIAGGTGSGTPIINKGKFSGLQLEIFESKDIQTKIGKILSNYDELIENNNQRIKILENTAQELYKEWFVHFRYPGYKQDKFEIHKTRGWSYGKSIYSCPISFNNSELIKIAEFKRGKNITSSEMIEGKIPVISAGLQPSGYHNDYNVEGKSVTVSASGANAGYLLYHLDNIWAADCSYCQCEYIWFVYNALKFLQPVITNLQCGSAQPHVYAKNLNKLNLILPKDRTLLKKYNDLVTPLYEEIKILNNKNDNLVKKRDALLPRLMSGKLSVEGKEIL